MVIDIFTYNGEEDLLEIHLNCLDKYVDQFIIVEATETFSGHPKNLYYEKQKNRFSKWQNKIKYHVVRPPYEEGIMVLANGSPNTIGAEHWKREFCQKESIKQALTHLKDKDICFIGDVDEIWEEAALGIFGDKKLKLLVYSYFLNNRSSEEFWGTIKTTYSQIKNSCLNHLRTFELEKGGYPFGWHFTSMGGYEEVKRKLNDSYTKESYNTDWVQGNLKQNIKNRRDFLGREFNFFVDEDEWPDYLKLNKDKYASLCL